MMNWHLFVFSQVLMNKKTQCIKNGARNPENQKGGVLKLKAPVFFQIPA